MSPQRSIQEQRACRSRLREAHFGIATLHIDTELWSTHGTLDVYQRGVDIDVSTAQWEITFFPEVDGAALLRNLEYAIAAETTTGRRFVGRAVLEHNVGTMWTLLDSGTPLDGLCVADLA